MSHYLEIIKCKIKKKKSKKRNQPVPNHKEAPQAQNRKPSPGLSSCRLGPSISELKCKPSSISLSGNLTLAFRREAISLFVEEELFLEPRTKIPSVINFTAATARGDVCGSNP